jgi:hydroxymethylglutaryl-CoA synthase
MAKPGIRAYATYIPRYRVARGTIAGAWGAPPRPGAIAVRAFDEDSLTMAQSAAARLLELTPLPDALCFASTTAPHWQRSAAGLIAAFCDLPARTATADFGGSLRCATAALRAALDAAACGRGTIVAAADARDARPESAQEMMFGDAAAAVAVGPEGAVAELEACVSRYDDFLDEWRREGDEYVQSFPSRFSTSRGYVANIVAAARDLLAEAGIGPSEIARAAIQSPDGAAHREAARAIGLDPESVEDPRADEFGVSGCASPLLTLARALDGASPGDRILLAAYGDGADAFLFRVTAAIESLPRPLVGGGAPAIEHATYTVHTKLRRWLREAAGGAEISNVLWEREEPQTVRLHGTFCSRCAKIQYPMTRVCGVCHAREGLVEKPLARSGQVFTFTRDYLYESPAPPTVMCVVELDDGARFLCQMTDCIEAEAAIGARVALTPRRLRGGGSMHHYYWKCRPV